MQHTRVAVLRGGPSSEYEVSMMTGKGVLGALKELGYYTKDIVIDKKGNWLVSGFIKTPEQALMDIDTVFIALHGSYGEDGTVQRIINRMRLPFTGSGAYASAVAMNKHLTKSHLKDSIVKLPKHMRLTRAGVSDLRQTTHSISQLFGPSYVVKPVFGGSSIGTVMVNTPYDLNQAITSLFNDYEEILVEEKISGREATVGIIENFRNSHYYTLPVIEIVPPIKSGFFSADVKYTGETDEICPGRFSKAEKESLSTAALFVHQILNLEQYSRSDFIVAPDGVYFLEVNTLPGLTDQSLFPKSMAAVGASYKDLVDHLIKTARP